MGVCAVAALYSAWAIHFRHNFFEIFGMYIWVLFEVIGCVLGGYWKSLPFFILIYPAMLNCYVVFRKRPIRSLRDLQFHLINK